MTLDQVTLADFSACQGQSFELTYEGSVVTAQLTTVAPLGRGVASDKRQSFSLLFHAPAACRFRQGTCQISHAQMGQLDIFMVALGPDAKGLRLEAIFNFA